jgi:hypothetical protein
LIGLTLFFFPSEGFSQNVRTREEIARLIPIEKISISTNGAVAGEVVNRSPNTVRDVQLLIRHVWLWEQETKPGKDDPSRSAYHTLPQEIFPGGRSPFVYKPSPPLPEVPGGRFITSAAVAGFMEVVLPAR